MNRTAVSDPVPTERLDTGPELGGDRPETTPARRTLARRWTALSPAVRWVIVLGLVVLVAASAFGLHRAQTAPVPLSQADVDRAVEAGLAEASKAAAAAPPQASVAFAAIQPSLVSITTAERGGGSARGSGTVVNDQGQVLTAWHVVATATRVTLRFADGTTSAAVVAAKDATKDTAVLTPAKLPGTVVPAVLGGGGQIGTPVFAVGDPLGLTYSLTAGVVSGTDRSVQVRGGPELSGLIQFDAAVNPGSSGGPLVDATGHVLGVVTGLANPSGQAYFAGVGFAVPIGQATGPGGGGPPH